MMEIVNIDAVLAQLVEQPPCKRQVVGAEPTHGSMKRVQAGMLAFLFMLAKWGVTVGSKMRRRETCGAWMELFLEF
mgnify:CR=1 FL=1